MDRVVAVNLTGCFNTVRLLSSAMRAARSGAIVEHVLGRRGRPTWTLWAFIPRRAKAALIGFTRHLAGELGPYGIRVNAVAPGRIDSPMVQAIGEDANLRWIRQTPPRPAQAAPRRSPTLCSTLPQTRRASSPAKSAM